MASGLSRARAVSSLSLAVLLLAGCDGARSLSGDCSLNRDCAAGERCVSGACVPELGAGACASSDDCAAGATCVSGRCGVAGALPCGSNADCPAQLECSAGSGLCVPRSGAVCSTSADCPVAQLCDLGECKDEAVLSRVCGSDEACGPGEICHASKCTAGCAAPRAPLSCNPGTSCDATSGRCAPDTRDCADDPDCGGSAVCLSGQCAVRCDLPGGLVCTGGFSCDRATGRCGADASCAADTDCGAPAGVCEDGRCVPGCAQLGNSACGAGSVCDTHVGRCVPLLGPCAADLDCGPPSRVCEAGQCVGGCTQAGGFQCSGASACNPATGRCGEGGPFCANDAECAAGQICSLYSGLCGAGCQATGCPSGETCQASGHCTSRGCIADAFEPNDSLAAARALALGNYGALTLCSGDDDFYAFDLLAGDPLELQVLFLHAEGDLDLELHGPNGQVLASASSASDNELISLIAPADGRYVLRIFMVRDLGPNPGNGYSLDLSLGCGEDRFEPNDSEAAARLLSPPVSEPQLSLCPGNDDFYAVQLTAGQTVQITARFLDDEGDIDLRLIRPSGSTAESASSTSDDETIQHTATETGRYLVRVFLFSDAGRRPGNRYELAITVGGTTPPPPPPPPPAPAATCTADEFEPNDTSAAAPAVWPGSYPGLTLCPGDDDYYAIGLVLEDRLTVNLSFSHAEGDIDLTLIGPSGTVVASSVSSTNDESFTYVAAQSGLYRIRARLFADAGSTPGNGYGMTVSLTPPASCQPDALESNDSPSSPRALQFGAYLSLTACEPDDDWYSVSLTAGQTYTFGALFAHAEGDIDMGLFDASGSVVASGVSEDDDEIFQFTPTTSGTYRLLVRLFEDAGGIPGNRYDLAVLAP